MKFNNLLKSTFLLFLIVYVEWQNSTPRFASTVERRNGNINLSKYFISSSRDRTHHQSVLQSHFCAAAPRLASNYTTERDLFNSNQYLVSEINVLKQTYNINIDKMQLINNKNDLIYMKKYKNTYHNNLQSRRIFRASYFTLVVRCHYAVSRCGVKTRNPNTFLTQWQLVHFYLFSKNNKKIIISFTLYPAK